MSKTPHHRAVKPLARSNARTLRQLSTDAEAKLWWLLRDRRLAEYKFRRQFPVDGYIVDFVCLSRRLIVEADGSQHLDSRKDAARDAHLQTQGFTIARYWNNDILQRPKSVLEDIFHRLQG